MQIRDQLTAWKARGDPYEVSEQADAERSQVDYWVKVTRYPDLEEMGFIVGDLIHHTRAALDNLIWQLGQRHGVPKEEMLPKLAFPVCRNVAGFADQTPLFSKFPRAAQLAIERFQPYHRPGGPSNDPLFILNKLWNDDKHRTPPLIVSSFIGSFVTTTNDVRFEEHFRRVRLTGDDPVHVGYVTLLDRIDTHVDAKLIIDVAFDENGPTGGRLLGDVLGEIYDTVANDVFPALEPFLR